MQRLVLLNFVVAFLFMATMLAFQKYESGWLLLTGMGLTVLLPCLALWNFCSIFVLWGRYGIRAFYPAICFVLAVTLSFQGSRYGTRIMLAGTPCRPETFLKSQTKLDLEKAATELLGHSFKIVSANPAAPALMVSGHKEETSPSTAINVMQKYGFREVEVDDFQSLVTFSYYHMRGWYRYTYTTDKLVPLSSRPPTITEADIGDWSELIRIALQGDHATADESTRIVFSPEIVYPYLLQQIGEAQLANLKGYSTDQEISEQQKELVLAALNRQSLPTSRLIENPTVTYSSNTRTLHLGGCSIDGFWVVFLVTKLLSDGVLVYASDNSHLKVRENLSPSDQNRIAWLNVGIMDFWYGNLFRKTEHFNDEDLGDGWYFTKS